MHFKRIEIINVLNKRSDNYKKTVIQSTARQNTGNVERVLTNLPVSRVIRQV